MEMTKETDMTDAL